MGGLVADRTHLARLGHGEGDGEGLSLCRRRQQRGHVPGEPGQRHHGRGGETRRRLPERPAGTLRPARTDGAGGGLRARRGCWRGASGPAGVRNPIPLLICYCFHVYLGIAFR
jgi:hypothetical protein